MRFEVSEDVRRFRNMKGLSDKKNVGRKIKVPGEQKGHGEER